MVVTISSARRTFNLYPPPSLPTVLSADPSAERTVGMAGPYLGYRGPIRKVNFVKELPENWENIYRNCDDKERPLWRKLIFFFGKKLSV